MEFKFNVQGELFCNRDGYSVINLLHVVTDEYENSEYIKDTINKMR